MHKGNILSKRQYFKQLLANDVQSVLDDWNGGAMLDVATVKRALANSDSDKFYVNNFSNAGWAYDSWADRFYRQLQSINGKGYGISILKNKLNNKLYAFNTDFAVKHMKHIVDEYSLWTRNYNR